jgi:hypothetical protein
LFSEKPEHPSLRFKKLGGYENIWSVRLSERYRAVGERRAIRSFGFGSARTTISINFLAELRPSASAERQFASSGSRMGFSVVQSKSVAPIFRSSHTRLLRHGYGVPGKTRSATPPFDSLRLLPPSPRLRRGRQVRPVRLEVTRSGQALQCDLQFRKLGAPRKKCQHTQCARRINLTGLTRQVVLAIAE